MASIQLQRSYFLSTTTAASSSPSLSFLPFMAKLQYRGFQNYPATSLPYTRVNGGDKFGNFSQINFRKIGIPALVNNIQPKILRLNANRNFHIFGSLTDSSRFAVPVQSQLRLGFPNAVTPIYGTLDIGIRFSSPYYKALAKRPFSQVPRVKNKGDNLGIRDGTAENTSLFKPFNKHRKWEKSLTAHRRSFNGAVRAAGSNQPTKVSSSSSRRSALSDGDMMTQQEQLVDNGRKDVDLSPSISTSPVSNNNRGSKATEKQRKQSRTKKNKEQVTSTDASSDVAQKKSTKSSSEANKSNITKKSQSPQASKNNSTGNKPVEALDSSVSTKSQSKKATGSSNKKGKSPKVANESPKKQTVHTMGKIKSLEQRPLKKLYPSSGKSVVVVESVTKAKVIQGYLGDMYEVLPSYGHVRDLAGRSGSVRPDDDFSMVWEVPSAAWTHLKSIKVALGGAENLILASDPDREGEAIAWHIIEMLLQQDALHKDLTVARVVFHEITESSIKSALDAPREIDVNLVHAYLARRALDYLIGFNISPLLWRKLPGCQSAGRVQSAALALICDREMEIDEFKPQEYWTVEVEFNRKQGSSMNSKFFPSYLTHFDSKKLNQFSISSHTEAKAIEQEINSLEFKVIGSKRNKMRKNPPTPYITSTLQQDAANKLHFSAMYTMKVGIIL
ncbi:DNA topoisomerase 1 [Vitis vinifera]|uniref:DNA topoisomerase 1 n=1 Tax=Vitis vinifera TaxID=29760 RepID=A0A438C1Y6_VITVI|nr:DNA topoisomerase 1 [Vitis vinifera]